MTRERTKLYNQKKFKKLIDDSNSLLLEVIHYKNGGIARKLGGHVMRKCFSDFCYGYMMSLNFELRTEKYNQPSNDTTIEYIYKIYYTRR